MNILDDIGVSKLLGNFYSGSDLFIFICVYIYMIHLAYNVNAMLTKLQQIQSESDMEELYRLLCAAK